MEEKTKAQKKKNAVVVIIGCMIILVFLAIVVLICWATKVPSRPSHLVCYQDGAKIVDVYTVNGVKLETINDGFGNYSAWKWTDDTGEHKLSISDTLSCQEDFASK